MIPLTAYSSQEDMSNASQFEIDHWELNELEAITGYPLDYRVTNTLVESVSTIKDAEAYLNEMYCSSVGVEFEHI
jgi:2-oxoglutarate dehydrogenase complex dehydrogenase (E1) component-like enzyme